MTSLGPHDGLKDCGKQYSCKPEINILVYKYNIVVATNYGQTLYYLPIFTFKKVLFRSSPFGSPNTTVIAIHTTVMI